MADYSTTILKSAMVQLGDWYDNLMWVSEMNNCLTYFLRYLATSDGQLRYGRIVVVQTDADGILTCMGKLDSVVQAYLEYLAIIRLHKGIQYCLSRIVSWAVEEYPDGF